MSEIVLSIVLLTLASVHAYWGAGGFWPGTNSLTLARTVAGFAGTRRMPPPSACFLVALVLVTAAILPLVIAGRIQVVGVPDFVPQILGAGCALVFLGRGLAPWLPAWRKLAPEQPFARLDRLLYGPLCLAIAALFFITLSKGILL